MKFFIFPIEVISSIGLIWLLVNQGDPSLTMYKFIYDTVKKFMIMKISIFSGMSFYWASHKHSMQIDSNKDYIFTLILLGSCVGSTIYPYISIYMSGISSLLVITRVIFLYKNK